MNNPVYRQMVAVSQQPQAQERSIAYLAAHLEPILKRQEQALICFQEHKPGNLSWLMEQAVLRCGGVPVVWGPDRTWKALLRQAFSGKVSVIIGAPLILLGLTKLQRYCATPLYVRKVVTAGYPCLDWMIEGINQGFDCVSGGCFGLGLTGVVAGASCGCGRGVHLRQEEYGVDIIDDGGKTLPPGQMGEIVLYPTAAPQLRFPMGDNARLDLTPCSCGNTEPRLVDFAPGRSEDPTLLPLGQELQSWTSVLDCRMDKGECGLEMEIVIFPGEKLPPLPTAAKRIVRPWVPEEDEPFCYDPSLKNPALRWEEGEV